MNHGIKVVRHSIPPRSAIYEVPGVLHRVLGHGESPDNEALAAELLCMRLHDDERTSRAAQECRIIHVWPSGSISGTPRLFDPEPQCVIKRTAALRKWSGLSTSRSDTAQSAPSTS